MKKLFVLLFASAMLFNVPNLYSQRKKKDDKIVKYEFVINIVSGSQLGKKYSGSFSYSTSGIKGKGEETVQVSSIDFDYRDIKFAKNGFDQVPTVLLKDGKLVDLIMGGGPNTKRFGLNCGFERGQFGRPEESFINEGKSYFGYLDSQTYVDGAGKILYKFRK